MGLGSLLFKVLKVVASAAANEVSSQIRTASEMDKHSNSRLRNTAQDEHASIKQRRAAAYVLTKRNSK